MKRESKRGSRRRWAVAGMVWTIVVILFMLWLLGYTVFRLAPAIHALLLLAAVAMVYNLAGGRRGV